MYDPSAVKVRCRAKTPPAKLHVVSNDNLPVSDTVRVAIHGCKAVQVVLDTARRNKPGTCGRMATLCYPVPVAIAWARTATHERFTQDCTDRATKHWQELRLR